MEKEFQLQLVKGEFELQEAKEILLNLVTDKIRFHQQKIVSVELMTGKKDGFSEVRISELIKSQNDLMAFLEENSNTAGKFKISGTINIEAV